MWISEVWRFLGEVKGTIKMSGIWEPKIQREDDSTIMEEVIKQELHPTCLNNINRCRLYLRVFFLSDITTADGTELEEWALTGNHRRKGPLLWPNQQSPSKTAWSQWRTMLCRAFTIDVSRSKQLRHKLGNWINHSHQQFQWEYDIQMKVLCNHQNNTKLYYVQSHTRNRFKITDVNISNFSPTHIASVKMINNQPQVIKLSQIFTPVNTVTTNEIGN